MQITVKETLINTLFPIYQFLFVFSDISYLLTNLFTLNLCQIRLADCMHYYSNSTLKSPSKHLQTIIFKLWEYYINPISAHVHIEIIVPLCTIYSTKQISENRSTLAIWNGDTKKLIMHKNMKIRNLNCTLKRGSFLINPVCRTLYL